MSLLKLFKWNFLFLIIHFLLILILRFNVPFIFSRQSDTFLIFEICCFFFSIAPILTLHRKIYYLLIVCFIELVSIIDFLKFKFIDFPLTAYDFVHIISDPSTLSNSLGFSLFFLYFILALSSGILFFLIYIFYLKHIFTLKNVYVPIIYIVFFFFSFIGARWTYRFYILNIYKNWKSSWNKHSISELNQRLGTFGFLYFTSLDSLVKANVFSIYNIKSKPYQFHELKSLNQKNTNIGIDKLPNIVFYLAESTFNPNAIFNSKYTISDNYLFRVTNSNEKNDKILVNAVGGGTHMSEFEAYTGLDTRLFGYYGQYTHAFLSPKLSSSFIYFLKDLGYRSTAFYPVPGNFYSASYGYKNYGFDEFIDSENLNITKTSWDKFSDVEFVAKSFVFWKNNGPFLKSYVSLENHSPHLNCKDFFIQYKFFDTNDESINCEMNVYLNRAKNTEKSVSLIRDKLQKIYLKTGRPYLIVIFGDHQPLTFTFNDKYKKFRKSNSSLNETFVKYISNDYRLLPKIKEGYNLTLLPSIVSSVLNKNYKNWYFPEQIDFYLSNGYIKNYDEYIGKNSPIYSYHKYINLN